MYRKLMMLLMAVAVLGLAIGLVGCPKKAAPPTGLPPPDEGMPGRPGPLPSPDAPLVPGGAKEEVPAEEAPAEEVPAEEVLGL